MQSQKIFVLSVPDGASKDMKKTGRILVVDDNTGILRTMEILLRMYFAEVKTLPSPVQLHGVLSEYRPHVVLLDMNFNDTLNTGNEGLY